MKKTLEERMAELRSTAQEIIYNSKTRKSCKNVCEKTAAKIIRPEGTSATLYYFGDNSMVYFDREGFGVGRPY